MPVPTVYPTANATRITDLYPAINTSTNNLGGGLILLGTFLIVFSALGNEPITKRVVAAGFLTFLTSIFGLLIGLTTWTQTGACLAITFVTAAVIQLTQNQG